MLAWNEYMLNNEYWIYSLLNDKGIFVWDATVITRLFCSNLVPSCLSKFILFFPSFSSPCQHCPFLVESRPTHSHYTLFFYELSKTLLCNIVEACEEMRRLLCAISCFIFSDLWLLASELEQKWRKCPCVWLVFLRQCLYPCALCV